jgi:hypothetical protein
MTNFELLQKLNKLSFIERQFAADVATLEVAASFTSLLAIPVSTNSIEPIIKLSFFMTTIK